MPIIKYTIDDIITFAESKGGKCLSKEYINNSTALKFKCSNNHHFKLQWANMLRKGHWCVVCKNKERKIQKFNEIQELADNLGGKCLSKGYYGSDSPHNWKCKNGHKIRKSPSDLGRWGWGCVKCENDKHHKIIQDIVKEKGGKCLFKRFEGVRNKKYKVQCKEGHIWYAYAYHLKKNIWCRTCAGKNPKTMKDLRRYAKDKGGKFISKEYKGINEHHMWECYNGHQFKATPSKIHNTGQWCPTCSAGLGERITRVYFEEIFQRKFPTIRPDWMKTKKGFRLELDGYCEKLQLAFEYQGSQHYEVLSIFITDKEQLKERKRVDRKKVRECKKRGITLLQIPEIGREFELNDFKMFLKDMFIDNGVSIPMNYDSIKIDVKKAYIHNESYYRLKKIVEDKGGKLISKNYINNTTNLTFKCDKGHKWDATPQAIKSNKWCHTCKGGIRYTIEIVRKIAKKRGDKCLSDDYKNQKSILKFKCKNGHISETQFRYYNRPSHPSNWCRECRESKQ